MKAIVIDEPWISLILSGQKTWEMRKTSCGYRGVVALIRKGGGQVVGVARIVDSLPSLATDTDYARAIDKHCIPLGRQPQARGDGWTIPWVLSEAAELAEPVAYRHPHGAVIWVNLEEEVATKVTAQIGHFGDLSTSSLNRMARLKATSRVASQPSASRAKAASRIEGDKAYVTLTDGNVRNGHFYLKSILEFFPPEAIGGSDKSQMSKVILTVDYRPGSKATTTDITGPNRLSNEKRSSHCFFRERAPTREFFRRSGAVGGDTVVIERISPMHFAVSLMKATHDN
ncbi:MAG: hypothetical protein K0R85_292 [Devosia sp.]|jgi:hypothetical protein|nr:hypothetical protein [Devosia sp.]